MQSIYMQDANYLSVDTIQQLFCSQKARLEKRFAAMRLLAESPAVEMLFAQFGLRKSLRGYSTMRRAVVLSTQAPPDALGQCTYAAIVRQIANEQKVSDKRVDRRLLYLMDTADKDIRFRDFRRMTQNTETDGRTQLPPVTPAFFLNTIRFLLFKLVIVNGLDKYCESRADDQSSASNSCKKVS